MKELKSSRQILVTAALPYANGQIHMGHLLEYIQADIWSRFQRMHKHEVYFVCADDAHGTAVMLKAESENISAAKLIKQISLEHQKDFKSFLISFDHYDSTDSYENRELVTEIYLNLRSAGFIEKRVIEQAYDPIKKMFLPDRFIKGGCPKCLAPEQYGDVCEICGAIYAACELIDSYSVLSKATPIYKEAEHYFFKLSEPICANFLLDWTQVRIPLQKEVRNKMQEWLGSNSADNAHCKLDDWDISRNAPYFGFEIPDAPGKYFYVWLDAPIAYLASFKKFCAIHNAKIASKEFSIKNDISSTEIDFFSWVKQDSQAEMVHFIGKDILYFHALFWPALLHFSGYRTPSNIFAHGFLNVNGKKMSKSRGTFITADSYIKAKLNPEWLRYYFASRLNASLEDLDLNLEDFVARVNSDLIGKYLNIASRSAGFLNKNFDGKVNPNALNHKVLQKLIDCAMNISNFYEMREYSKAMRLIMELADIINSYINNEKPWDLAKQIKLMQLENISDAALTEQLHIACTVAIEAFRILTLYIKPVLPQLALQVEGWLGIDPLTWDCVNSVLDFTKNIPAYTHLMRRIELDDITKLLCANASVNQNTDIINFQ